MLLALVLLSHPDTMVTTPTIMVMAANDFHYYRSNSPSSSSSTSTSSVSTSSVCYSCYHHTVPKS